MNNHFHHVGLQYLSSDLFSHFLDGVGEVMFFLKDKNSILINGNLLMAENCGLNTIGELIGKSDYDLFPHELAEHYRADDAEVFHTKKSKQNIVELFPNHVGTLQWIVCNKTPVLDDSGSIQGLLGLCQPFEKSQIYGGGFRDISLSLEYIKENYTKNITNEQLAMRSGISVRQFEKRFKQLFNTSAHQYVLKLRILKACELLIRGDMSMIDIADSLGFYDQSAFISCFKRQMKITPLKYIKKHLII